jgi:hypothetical protein
MSGADPPHVWGGSAPRVAMPRFGFAASDSGEGGCAGKLSLGPYPRDATLS